MTISETILAQLGGQRFKAMTGAKNFSHNDSMLAFQLPRGTTKNKAVQVYIHYDAGKDLYEMSFYRFKRDYTPVEIEIIYDLDVEAMRSVFVDRTGLYLSL
jgi:hypothetical protein